MILSTPYLHVQAIRRRYQDEGKPTFAKVGYYLLDMNEPTGNAGLSFIGSVAMDADSDFVWLSSYLYLQTTVWSSESAADNEEILPPGSSNRQEIQLQIGETGEYLSNPPFMPTIPFDWLQGPIVPGLNQEGSELIDGEAGVVSIGTWRHFLPEPIVLKASSTVIGTMRTIVAMPTFHGNVLTLVGVRLYVGGPK